MRALETLIILFLLMSVAGAVTPVDISYAPYETATGRYITPVENLGGPWFHDNHGPTFGDDKDATIKYNSATSMLTLEGSDVEIARNLTLGRIIKNSAILTTNTTLAAATAKPFYWLSPASGKGLNITLPTAASMNNYTVEFCLKASNTGSCTTLIDAYGAEKINNAATKAATAKYADIEVKSDGSEWHIVKSAGTWS